MLRLLPARRCPGQTGLHRRLLSASAALRAQTLVEKIAQSYAVNIEPGHKVRSGDFVAIQPEHVMTHDNTGAVMSKFVSIGARSIYNPRQPVFTLDHDVQNKSEQNLRKYKSIEEFAKQHKVDFYPAGRGIGHQVMVEEGYAFPHTMVVASDSHSNMYGGIGCLGTPIVRTDAAALWATGRTWWQIPPVVRVDLHGSLPPGVTGKDVIITLCGVFNNDEVLNTAVEFTGDGVATLSLEDRLAIANMTTEWGALAGLFPVDRVTLSWLDRRADLLAKRAEASSVHQRINHERISVLKGSIMQADTDCKYAKTLTLDLSSICEHVSGPDSVKLATPLPVLEDEQIKINKAYLVSCVNSRLTDIHEAANVMRNRHVKDGVSFYIAAASSEVQADAEASGDWEVLLKAGAIPLPSGCGPCIGLGIGLLEDGEVGISATNRNFKGRMGSTKAHTYLASPAVVAASAVAGQICGPSSLGAPSPAPLLLPKYSIAEHDAPPTADKTEEASGIIEGFPSKFAGRLVFCNADNLNTDAIYPGKYTYQDGMTTSDMQRIVMENYDTEFAANVQKGDILVGGFNFGTGSSREQAATAIKAAGVQLVLAGSFSDTFKRNAINNALLLLECPELVRILRKRYAADKSPTVWSNATLSVDPIHGSVSVSDPSLAGDRPWRVPAVGRAAQEIITEGGLEQWIKNRI